jgi:GNAT superfamily N-acetyltransferase
MSIADVPSALTLCRQAGWNQTNADWQRILAYEPEGCFVAVLDEQIVGTVTSTCYSTDLAWIGMMLVDDSHRRRGIATQLMTTCLQSLRSRGIGCIKLDATPLGEPVYQLLGFQREWTFHRWSLRFTDNLHGNVSQPASIGLEPGVTARIDPNLDHMAFGVDRTNWLDQLQRDSKTIASPNGFGMMRVGQLADYLGPIVAKRPTDAEQIIRALLQERQTDIFWDIPGPNQTAAQLAESLGFQPVRDLTRMWLGEEIPRCDLTLQYALADPGTG